MDAKERKNLLLEALNQNPRDKETEKKQFLEYAIKKLQQNREIENDSTREI